MLRESGEIRHKACAEYGGGVEDRRTTFRVRQVEAAEVPQVPRGIAATNPWLDFSRQCLEHLLAVLRARSRLPGGQRPSQFPPCQLLLDVAVRISVEQPPFSQGTTFAWNPRGDVVPNQAPPPRWWNW